MGWTGLKFSFGLLVVALINCGCSNGSSETVYLSRVGPDYLGPAELSFCTTPIGYATSYAIQGVAKYEARQLIASTTSSACTGLGAPGAPVPIRFAEIRVTDSSGNIIQCGETAPDGSFNIAVPQTQLTYTLSINARSDSSNVKISVLNKPELNNIYALSTAVVANSDQDLGDVVAPATGSVLGGAFNIYDQILNANDFLKLKVPSFAGLPKVSVYWEKGFNPNSYFGYPYDGLSFYLMGYHRLFIMGGVNGDVDNTDTDHFDNSVIIHEYGHFIEDVYGTTDSPGLRHYGTGVIDPRLAWSEGWGNFFQAAVQNLNYYTDTHGNNDGTPGCYFHFDLESPNVLCLNQSHIDDPGCDLPAHPGEGNFREFAVTRFLWDINDSQDDGADAISDKFSEIWETLTSATGMGYALNAFRDFGLFALIQSRTAGLSDWSSLEASPADPAHIDLGSLYYMIPDRSKYAQYVLPSGTCAGTFYSMTPDSNPAYFNSVSPYDLTQYYMLENNQFFHFKHSGGPLSLTLNYVDVAGTGPVADLNLYLYSDTALIGDTDPTNMLAKSISIPVGAASGTFSETFSVSAPLGNYLIQVNANSGSGSAANFELIYNTNQLCKGILP